jgi:hypothetical protein
MARVLALNWRAMALRGIVSLIATLRSGRHGEWVRVATGIASNIFGLFHVRRAGFQSYRDRAAARYLRLHLWTFDARSGVPPAAPGPGSSP